MRKRLERLGLQGKSRYEAAEALGVTYLTCCRRIAAYGLKPLFAAAEFKARKRATVERFKRRRREQLEGERP